MFDCEYCNKELQHSTVEILGTIRTFEIMCECRRDRNYFDKSVIIDLYCENCIHDQNKDSDPTCNILNELLAGEIMFSCKKYKKLWRR